MRDDWADLDARAQRDPRRETGERLASAWRPFADANERAQDAALTHAMNADDATRTAPYAAGAVGSQDFGAGTRGPGRGAPTVRGYPAYQGAEFADESDVQVAASTERPFRALNEAASGQPNEASRGQGHMVGHIGETQGRATALSAVLNGYANASDADHLQPGAGRQNAGASIRGDAAADNRNAAFSGRMAPDSGIIEQAWRATPVPGMEAGRELAGLRGKRADAPAREAFAARSDDARNTSSFIQNVWESGPASAAAPIGNVPESVMNAASGAIGESAAAGGGTPGAASSAGIPYGTPALQDATGFGTSPAQAGRRGDARDALPAQAGGAREAETPPRRRRRH